MTPNEIRNLHNVLIMTARDYIYAICEQKGTKVCPTDNLRDYFSLKPNIKLTTLTRHSELCPLVVEEIRAYIAEGWIDVKLDSAEELIDLNDLFTEDILDIVEHINN